MRSVEFKRGVVRAARGGAELIAVRAGRAGAMGVDHGAPALPGFGQGSVDRLTSMGAQARQIKRVAGKVAREERRRARAGQRLEKLRQATAKQERDARAKCDKLAQWNAEVAEAAEL